MKKLRNSSLILFVLILPFGMFGQDEITYGSGSITDSYCVTIDSESPVKEFYELDISHLHIVDSIEALNKFGHIENNLVSYTVDLESQTAYLHLFLDRTVGPKDIVWWSAYLETLCGL